MKKEVNKQSGFATLVFAGLMIAFGGALATNPTIAGEHQDKVQEYKLNK